MAKSKFFDVTSPSFEFDFLKFFDDPGRKQRFIKALGPVLDRIEQHSLERIRANAPVKTGALRKSLRVEREYTDTSIIFHYASDHPAAFRLHEEPYKAGLVSQAHEHTMEGGVGNKYITRVIDFWMPTYEKWLTEAFIKFIEKELIK